MKSSDISILPPAQIRYDADRDKIFTVQNVAGRYKYWYTGKEWQNNLDLNVYDYGARQYDPAVGRWFVMAPKVEDINQISYSPCTNAWNSPINLNNPDGKCPLCIATAAGANGVGTANTMRKTRKIKKISRIVFKSTIGKKIIDKSTEIIGDAVSIMVGAKIQGNEINAKNVTLDVVFGQAGKLEERFQIK